MFEVRHTVPREIKSHYTTVDEDAILVGWRGSHVTGMATEKSDFDLIGIVIPDISHYFDLNGFGSNGKGTREDQDGGWDMVSHEFVKAMKLLRKGNFNLMQLLWLPDGMYIKRTEMGQRLIGFRQLFITKGLVMALMGVAQREIRRATSGVHSAVSSCGYIPKSAYHAILYLQQAIEILTEEVYKPVRSDLTLIKTIRDGDITEEGLMTLYTELDKKAMSLCKSSELPDKADMDLINDLCVMVLREHFHASGRITV
ncbi:hypothetical protein DRO66_00605 [Candidatus Bathyarchaeota archaeon]|nr:MAG: hypothetical protein DRO66_00605 [Candidatus Bathyarchaeota archaeon]